MNDPVVATRALASRLTEICARVDRQDLIGRLRPAVAALDDDSLTVVVAGEGQRGKSSLVNAILGVADVVPAGADRSTPVPISVAVGQPGRARVNVPGRPSVALATADLPALLDRPLEPDGTFVSDVEVWADHPLLHAGVRIVDTPALGGMEVGRASFLLALVARADAMLFVTDPTTPLTRSELAFLLAAAERTTIVFVLAKTDSTAGWREILRDDRLIVEEHAPALASAPWFAVSALTATTSESAPPGVLDDESGVSALIDALGSLVVERGRAVRAANALRVCRGIIDALAEPEVALLAALEGTVDEATAAERASLHELLGRSASWRAELETEMRRLAIDVESETDFAFSELGRRFEARVTSAKRLAPDAIAADLTAEIAAMWVDTDRYVHERLALVVDSIVEHLELAGAAPAVAHFTMPDRVRDVIRDCREVAPAKVGGAETLLQYYPVIFSGGLVATVSTYLNTLFTVSANPVQVALAGLATMGVTFNARRTAVRRATNRQEAMQLVRSALGQARSSISKQVSRLLVDSRVAIESGIAAELDLRRAELARREAEQAAVPRDAAARRKVGERARQRLASLDQVRTEIDGIERRLSTDSGNLGTGAGASRSDLGDVIAVAQTEEG